MNSVAILARGVRPDEPGVRMVGVVLDICEGCDWPCGSIFSRSVADRPALNFLRSTPARDATVVRHQYTCYEARFVFPHAFPRSEANLRKFVGLAWALSNRMSRFAAEAALSGVVFAPQPFPVARPPWDFIARGNAHTPSEWLEAFGIAPPSPAEIEAFEKAEAAELAVRLEEAKTFAAEFVEATRRAPHASEAAARTGRTPPT
jgi:hypothetical protein